MSVQAVLVPVFVQVALTFILLLWMGYQRFGSLRRGEAHVRDIALGQPNWPPRTLQAANALNNQFQLPVLFYVVVTLALLLHKADFILVVLSWVFVVSRIVHALVHVTANDMRLRFGIYFVGVLALLLMWILFALQILLAA
jgi:hypothetical protein